MKLGKRVVIDPPIRLMINGDLVKYEEGVQAVGDNGERWVELKDPKGEIFYIDYDEKWEIDG